MLQIIMLTCPCNVDPLTPHFYIFYSKTGVYEDTCIHFYARNFEKVGSILVSACPYVCTCMYGASIYRLETSCVDSSWKNCRHVFFSELPPLVKLRPFEKQRNEIL